MTEETKIMIMKIKLLDFSSFILLLMRRRTADEQFQSGFLSGHRKGKRLK